MRVWAIAGEAIFQNVQAEEGEKYVGEKRPQLGTWDALEVSLVVFYSNAPDLAAFILLCVIQWDDSANLFYHHFYHGLFETKSIECLKA
ncbi:hypothetical protein BSKO_09891 [Bryopsis sp. KO-2023]|nr:hypothetical protein BSKO_09891 [Bryopsis sp. KO-2023]